MCVRDEALTGTGGPTESRRQFRASPELGVIVDDVEPVLRYLWGKYTMRGSTYDVRGFY